MVREWYNPYSKKMQGTAKVWEKENERVLPKVELIEYEVLQKELKNKFDELFGA